MLGKQSAPPWAEDVRKLKKWLIAYVALLLVGWAGFISPYYSSPSNSQSSLMGGVTMFGFVACLIPYVGSLAYAYRVQERLNTEGLDRSGAWQVVVVGIILNPWLLGPAHVAGILGRAKKGTKQWQGRQPK
jgi:hypothetical protein